MNTFTRQSILGAALVFVAMHFAGCWTTTKKPTAGPTVTPGVKSPVTPAIEALATNQQAVVAALERQASNAVKSASVAAASVEAAKNANTNQPPAPATTFVDKELDVARKNLPAPDGDALLKAEQRRVEVFAGRLAEADKLYAAAQTEAQKLKSDNERLKAEGEAQKAKTAEAHAALLAADARFIAELERNKAANQAALDAANKKAADAEEKAKNERHKLIFRALLGLGLACIAGAIAMAVLTNGAMLMKSLILAGGGAVCIGIAQIVSHPWFDAVFGTCVGLAAVGGGIYLWMERRDALAKEAYKRTVAVLDGQHAIKDEEGKETALGVELSKALDTPHKNVVKLIKRATAIKEARAA